MGSAKSGSNLFLQSPASEGVIVTVHHTYKSPNVGGLKMLSKEERAAWFEDGQKT